MHLRDSFKEHYLLESSRRNELTAALSVPIAILTVVLGALAVVAKDLHAPLEPAGILQLVFVVLGAGAGALCTYFLFRSIYGLAYAFVPTPQELELYRDTLALYYMGTGLGGDVAKAQAEAETVDYLYSEYAKNAHRNSNNNDIKSGHLHNANSTLIAAVVMAALAAIVHVYASIRSPAATPRVEVVNMPALSSAPAPAPAPLAAASSPPQPPFPPPPPPVVKPEPPPSKVIREYQVPPPPPPPPPRR